MNLMNEEAAFPSPHFAGIKGMTLRDYFAAKALQGVASDSSVSLKGSQLKEAIAVTCYGMADAMIKAREL